MLIRSLASPLLVAALVAGCGSSTYYGVVGERLTGGGFKISVERVDPHPPIPTSDSARLGAPSPGRKLIGVRVNLCTRNRAAVGPSNFSIVVAGVGQGTLRAPQQNYADSLRPIRTGCENGWIVFELPAAGTASQVLFDFYKPYPGGGDKVIRERFTWALT